jgi:hypothetical protein
MRFLVHAVSASVAAIAENFQAIAGRPSGGNVFADAEHDDLSKEYGWHKNAT